MPHPSTPFQFVVSDLRRAPGKTRRVTIEAPVDYHIDLAGAAGDPPLYADLELRSIPGGIMVDGSVDYEVEVTCQRCLTTRTEPESRRLLQLVEPQSSEDADYVLDGDLLDLEPLIRDEVTLALPLVPRCRPDCAGLCPVCGADLNTDACPGHAEDSTSPFAVLRDLIPNQE